MERLILRDPRLEGFMDLQVLSFRRLAWRVLEETGGTFYPFITPVGKSMAVQAILWDSRKDLTVFAPLVNYPGFRDNVTDTLNELHTYEVSPDDLDARVTGIDAPFLEQKVHDLGVVYRGYVAFLKDRFLDPTDYLNLASERMSASRLVKGATVWIDGFSGFNPDEYRALGALLETAREVNVALCIDEEAARSALSEDSLFHQTREALEKIREVAWKKGVPEVPPVILGRDGPLPRFECRDLAVLEAALRGVRVRADGATKDRSEVRSAPSGQPGPDGSGPENAEPSYYQDGVQVVAAANPLAEVEFVAREIIRLVRDCGYRYRDITVETRELDKYSELVSLVFKDHGIPHFIDEKRSVSHHPLAELLRAALDVVLTSFSSEAVFRYLKTDLVPVSREEVDILENYVLAHGINHQRWVSEEPWRFKKRYMVEEDRDYREEQRCEFCDKVRRKAVEHLAAFYASVQPKSAAGTGHDSDSSRAVGDPPASGDRIAPCAADVSLALYKLLVDLDVPGTLEKWQTEAEEAGDLAESMVHAGIWDKTMEILEQAAEILKDRQCDLRTYALLLDAGLHDIRLGVIPPSLDQVLVGNLDRSRQPACKATFLLGATAGSFPKRHSDDGIFTDGERERLMSLGIEMSPGSRLKQLHEKYLVYIALTRPSHRLYVSYPLGDAEGKALEPSHVVGTIRKILGDRPERLVSMDPPGRMPDDLDYLLPARVLSLTVRRLALGKQGVFPGLAWAEALRYLTARERDAHRAAYGDGTVQERCADMEHGVAIQRVLRSLEYRNFVPPLRQSTVRRLYGSVLATSVSRLERFSACPFSHFAADGLRLKERDVYKLEPADAGTFLHNALKEFVSEVQSGKQDWTALTDADIDNAVSRVVERLIPQVQEEIFLSSARYRHVGRALGRITRRAAGVLAQHAKRAQFRPVALEAQFGLQGKIPPLVLPLGELGQVTLRGQIDRLDACAVGDATYLRVIDYKSSPRPLDLTDVYEGLSLQLLVYLLVAVSSWKDIVPDYPPDSKVVPAGALYFVVRDPIISTSGPVPEEQSKESLLKSFRMAGLVAGDRQIAGLMDSEMKGYSPIIPVQFTKDALGARSSVVPKDKFPFLLDFVKEKVRELAGQVLKGRADIMPYRRGQKRACTYCPFGPLCQFDALIPGNYYRNVKPVPPEVIWNELGGQGAPEGGTGQ